ncbi:outer membrane protein assembly factor BamA [Sulfurimonas sp.]|nr:outer membrane protein assembly factor BamA [Sulfurimonas sp.]
MKIFLATLLTLLAVNSFAYTIKSINYKGMVHISQNVAIRMLDFEIGDTIDDDMLNKSLKKYYEQGYFEDAWIDMSDGHLTFNFKEKPLISKVQLKGWKEEDEEVLGMIVQVKRGSLYDEKKLEAAKKRIIQALAQETKIDSIVEIEKEYLENGSMQVTFVVSEGEEIIIESLVYDGVFDLDSEEFNEVIANKQREFMGWFYGQEDGKMKLNDLGYDNLRIKEEYMKKGYLDADVRRPFVKVNFDNYTANMSYQIDEGKPYTISAIKFNQEKEVIDDALIREVVKLKVGEYFNIETFRKDSEKIKTLISDLSYAFVSIVPDLRKDKEKQTVEVVFRIVPGERVKIRNVIISGNSRTLDRIVRRELYLGPGDMYSLTDLKDSRNSLGRLGFFEENTIEEERVDESTMDLVVKVKEAPTGNIQVGGGYGSYGGLLVSVSVDDRNIYGSGINAALSVEQSSLTSSYSFSISNPRLNDSDFSGSFSVFASDYEYNDYTTTSNGFGLGLGHRLSRYMSANVGYNFSSNDYDGNITTNTATSIFYESYSKSSITFGISYDNTDDYYLPRNGMTFQQSIEYAGVGGDANFIKSRTEFAVYKGLEDWLGFDIIARYKARLFYAHDSGNLPIAERFYMGGIGSIRGYEAYSLSPEIDDDNNVSTPARRVGGEYTASNSFELSFPMIPKAKMRLVAFVDYGLIGATSDQLTSNNAPGIDYIDKSNNITRGGYGLGIEWFSPVGPVQIMFANAVGEEEGDKTSTFEFSMGQRF